MKRGEKEKHCFINLERRSYIAINLSWMVWWGVQRLSLLLYFTSKSIVQLQLEAEPLVPNGFLGIFQRTAALAITNQIVTADPPPTSCIVNQLV